MVAGVGDKMGCFGRLGLSLSQCAGNTEGRRHIKGKPGAFQREISEVEPHFFSGDVTHLGQVGADARDQRLIARRGAATTVCRTGEESKGEEIDSARFSKVGHGGIERSGGFSITN